MPHTLTSSRVHRKASIARSARHPLRSSFPWTFLISNVFLSFTVLSSPLGRTVRRPSFLSIQHPSMQGSTVALPEGAPETRSSRNSYVESMRGNSYGSPVHFLWSRRSSTHGCPGMTRSYDTSMDKWRDPDGTGKCGRLWWQTKGACHITLVYDRAS